MKINLIINAKKLTKIYFFNNYLKKFDQFML